MEKLNTSRIDYEMSDKFNNNREFSCIINGTDITDIFYTHDLYRELRNHLYIKLRVMLRETLVTQTGVDLLKNQIC